MTSESSDPIAEARRLRGELAAALDEFEYRINAPQRLYRRIQAMAKENPGGLAAIGAGTAAAAGACAWLAVRILMRR